MLDMNWKPPVLETERLIIRPVDVADAGDIFLYCSNPNITRWTLFHTHQTIDDTLVFLRDYRQSRYVNQEPDPLGIVMKNDPTRCVMGAIGCFWNSRTDGVMELGYSLAEPYWGRGIIAEAGRAVIRYIFQTYPVERLQARVIGGNDASCRVALKLGMKDEGTLRSALFVKGRRVDVRYFAMLRSEFSE